MTRFLPSNWRPYSNTNFPSDSDYYLVLLDTRKLRGHPISIARYSEANGWEAREDIGQIPVIDFAVTHWHELPDEHTNTHS